MALGQSPEKDHRFKRSSFFLLPGFLGYPFMTSVQRFLFLKPEVWTGGMFFRWDVFIGISKVSFSAEPWGFGMFWMSFHCRYSKVFFGNSKLFVFCFPRLSLGFPLVFSSICLVL